jgi:chromosome segregation ATPase
MPTFDEVTERESLELMGLINRVDNYLVTRKTRTLLKSDIASALVEIGFTQDRYALVVKHLGEINSEIDSKKPILTDLNNKLSVLEPQLKDAEMQYLNLKKMQEEIETKKDAVEEKKATVNRLKKETEELTLILDKINAEYEFASNRKSEIDAECSAFDSRKASLEEEVKVMRNTDDLLKGLIPEGLSAEVMSGVVNNIEVVVKKYMGEIEFTIELIEGEISRKRLEIENKDLESRALIEERDGLSSEIMALEPFRLSDEQREKVLAEINQLRDTADEISTLNEKKEMDFQHIEYELMGVEENLQTERDFESHYFDRYAYMSQLKKDISELRDVNAEINRLKDETRLLKVKEDVSRHAYDEIAAVRDEAGNINIDMSSKIDQFKEILVELDQIIKG